MKYLFVFLEWRLFHNIYNYNNNLNWIEYKIIINLNLYTLLKGFLCILYLLPFQKNFIFLFLSILLFPLHNWISIWILLNWIKKKCQNNNLCYKKLLLETFMQSIQHKTNLRMQQNSHLILAIFLLNIWTIMALMMNQNQTKREILEIWLNLYRNKFLKCSLSSK